MLLRYFCLQQGDVASFPPIWYPRAIPLQGVCFTTFGSPNNVTVWTEPIENTTESSKLCVWKLTTDFFKEGRVQVPCANALFCYSLFCVKHSSYSIISIVHVSYRHVYLCVSSATHQRASASYVLVVVSVSSGSSRSQSLDQVSTDGSAGTSGSYHLRWDTDTHARTHALTRDIS